MKVKSLDAWAHGFIIGLLFGALFVVAGLSAFFQPLKNAPHETPAPILRLRH